MPERDYFDDLTKAIISQVPTVGDYRVELDDWMGTIRLVNDAKGLETYATPGWEGESLPIHTQRLGTGDVLQGQDLGTSWTGDIKQDVALWVDTISKFLASNTMGESEIMNNEVEDIKRLAGINEQVDSMAQMRQLISGVDQALAANDIGRAKAILRDMYRLSGGTDEGY